MIEIATMKQTQEMYENACPGYIDPVHVAENNAYIPRMLVVHDVHDGAQLLPSHHVLIPTKKYAFARNLCKYYTDKMGDCVNIYLAVDPFNPIITTEGVFI